VVLFSFTYTKRPSTNWIVSIASRSAIVAWTVLLSNGRFAPKSKPEPTEIPLPKNSAIIS